VSWIIASNGFAGKLRQFSQKEGFMRFFLDEGAPMKTDRAWKAEREDTSWNSLVI
jgi:antibiotic biosynthesis monooxygenase (ABM) superfamily enzyme